MAHFLKITDFSLKKNFIFLILFSFFLTSCQEEKKKEESEKNKSVEKSSSVKKEIIPSEFNPDSAYFFIEWQAKVGPRVPGTSAHNKFIKWAVEKLKMYGAEVQVQKGMMRDGSGKDVMVQNIIASFYPERKERIMLCAHYDSRPISEKEKEESLKKKPCPGVNDGASGVGVLLEMARNLKKQDPGLGIDIILFDYEDAGDNNGAPETWCLGSQYWSGNPHVSGYSPRYTILLDMVGHGNATFPKEGYSMYYASDVVDKIWKTARQKGFSKYFTEAEGPELTDDHLFINQKARIPCVDIVDYKIHKMSFFEYHHTQKDDISIIDKNTLFAVGTTLMYVIYNEK